MEPFIVDGTTYLPLRAVADALGKEVELDGPNQSVYVGRKPYTPIPLDPTTAKIAIITFDKTQEEEEYYSAQEVVRKHGENRVIHKVFPNEKNGIDMAELKKIMECLAEVKVYTSEYEEDGEKYPNWLTVREDYIT